MEENFSEQSSSLKKKKWSLAYWESDLFGGILTILFIRVLTGNVFYLVLLFLF